MYDLYINGTNKLVLLLLNHHQCINETQNDQKLIQTENELEIKNRKAI